MPPRTNENTWVVNKVTASFPCGPFPGGLHCNGGEAPSFEGHGAEGTITTLHTTSLLQRKSVTHVFGTKGRRSIAGALRGDVRHHTIRKAA